ncbi:hypothetical protein DW66_2357 [Pseudomonas putida]|nr:hypothetical protein DW66_2357 [Pseudomonas putida]AJG14258.1 hypothetical protein RK21_02750 [Pseudomonas plecoglossicida]
MRAGVSHRCLRCYCCLHRFRRRFAKAGGEGRCACVCGSC